MSREDVLVEALERIGRAFEIECPHLGEMVCGWCGEVDGDHRADCAATIATLALAARATPQTPAACHEPSCVHVIAGIERSHAQAPDGETDEEFAARVRRGPAQTPVVDPVVCPRCSKPIRQEAMHTGCRVITVAGVPAVCCRTHNVVVNIPLEPPARLRASTGRAARPARWVAHETVGSHRCAGRHVVNPGLDHSALCDDVSNMLETDRAARATYLETPGADEARLDGLRAAAAIVRHAKGSTFMVGSDVLEAVALIIDARITEGSTGK